DPMVRALDSAAARPFTPPALPTATQEVRRIGGTPVNIASRLVTHPGASLGTLTLGETAAPTPSDPEAIHDRMSTWARSDAMTLAMESCMATTLPELVNRMEQTLPRAGRYMYNDRAGILPVADPNHFVFTRNPDGSVKAELRVNFVMATVHYTAGRFDT